MRRILAGTLIAWAAACISMPAALAQSGWKPTRPVAFVVGATPGGSLDLTARLIQRIWDQQQTVSQPVIVINKAGAGQGLAWDYMRDRGGTGHAIALGGPNLISNQITGLHAVGYQDVTPIAMLLDDYIAFVVRSDSPLKSVRDVVERLRKDPGAVSIACGPALGGGAHIGAVVGLKAGGVRIQDARFVVYKSAGEAVIAVLSGEVDVAVGTVANYPAHLASGRIRAIGVTAPRRLGGVMAGVPTLTDQGIDAVFTTWRNALGPKTMTREQIVFWEGAFAKAVESEEWKKELERNFWTPNFVTGDGARKYLAQQTELYQKIFAELGLAKSQPRR
ncbi:MAG: tripartite tricarboxylate transporter substrate binding protein [Burkholderiales bacterium]|nr:tripartite tricarboxylate transporter substrate binding protein [Burkholderiales bacterium]